VRRDRAPAATWVPSCTAGVQLCSEAGSISVALRNAVPMLMPMPMEWLPEVRSSWDSFREQFSQQLQGVREQTVIRFGKLLGAEVQVQGRPQPSAPAGGSHVSNAEQKA
jgi:hypothetical protein